MRMLALCVDPARVHEFWPHVWEMLAPALPPGGLGQFADLERDVLDGRNLLWIAYDPDEHEVKAAVVTHLGKVDDDLICTILACGGHDMKQWIHLVRSIEEYARAEGCQKVRVWGRPGWSRVLNNYHLSRVVLERHM